MTSTADRQLLLDIAREAIAAHVERREARIPPMDGILARHGGAFVSLHIGRELRGCIGHIEPNQPLGRVIPRCAVEACSADPRFRAVAQAEVPLLIIELSLLGPLETIDGPDGIEIGRHGLLVESEWHRGLLLPQVATEWDWNREAFLAHTCQKAGLAADAWKHGVKLWRFEAEVFAEP